MSNMQQKPSSSTAQATPDSMGMGRTQGQRSAEVMAGIRAEVERSPEAIALSRLAGRLFARLILSRIKDAPAIRFPIARPKIMQTLVERYISTPDGTIVDMAAGFSPNGLQLARAFPNAQVIEIDLPDVVAEKQNRLRRAHNVSIPPNIRWIGADLGVETLDVVLGGTPVDCVIASGLLVYFDQPTVHNILTHIHKTLTPGGILICDVLLQSTLDGVMNAGRERSVYDMFRRQAGSFKWVATPENAPREFEAAGFTEISVHKFSELAREIALGYDIFDFGIAVKARKPAVSDLGGASAPNTQ